MSFNPKEVAQIQIGGAIYAHWESIEVERRVGEILSTVRFVAPEPHPPGDPRGWQYLPLLPGAPVAVFLAGEIVFNGILQVRQVSYDAQSHSAQFSAVSYTSVAMGTTVKANPGEYLNQSIQAIFNAVCAPVGLNVVCKGSMKPFARVAEQMGETRAAFMQRIARWRNMHPVDDATQTLNWIEDPVNMAAAALLEGGNILAARILVKSDIAPPMFQVVTQNVGGSASNVGGSASADVTGSAPYASIAPLGDLWKSRGDMSGDATDAEFAAKHDKQLNALTQLEATITVPGWFAPSGLLWINCLGAPITINSVMLLPFPFNPFVLILRGVKHMQDSNRGTITELDLCTPAGLSDSLAEAVSAADAAASLISGGGTP